MVSTKLFCTQFISRYFWRPSPCNLIVHSNVQYVVVHPLHFLVSIQESISLLMRLQKFLLKCFIVQFLGKLHLDSISYKSWHIFHVQSLKYRPKQCLLGVKHFLNMLHYNDSKVLEYFQPCLLQPSMADITSWGISRRAHLWRAISLHSRLSTIHMVNSPAPCVVWVFQQCHTP